MCFWRAAVLGLSLMAACPASAAIFIVNNIVDGVDVTPGDGVCASAGGVCTLRAAVMETNALAGADVVNVPAGTHQLAIPGRSEGAAATGDLDVTDDLTLRGVGAERTIIDADSLDRVLDFSPPNSDSTMTVIGLTITGGLVHGDEGGFEPGGGIRSTLGRVSVADTTISGNSADAGGGVAVFGGALEAQNVVVAANTAATYGGGIAHVLSEPATIESSAILGNASGTGGGGGVFLGCTDLTLIASFVSHNTTEGWGGGVFAHSASGFLACGSVLTVRDSAIVANEASSGGGVKLTRGAGGRVSFPSILRASNSTFAENTGGGIGSSQSVAFLDYAVVSANTGGGFVASGGLDSIVHLKGTILAGQAGGADCVRIDGTEIVLDSRGHNLDSDGTCGLTDSTDLPNTDPMLGPLQDNGGPTPTHALLAGSPAIDAISPADCTWDNDFDPGTPEVPVATDQRGIGRPFGSACDIGAFEAVAASCGLGPELAVLLPALLWLRERMRRRAA